MLVAYLDDSGNDGENDVTVMGGYAASEVDWASFDALVQPIFSQFDVDVLHTKDLFSTRGTFKGWSVDRKYEFLDAIYTCLRQARPLGVAFAVNNQVYLASKRRDNVNHQISAYGMCFNAIIDILIKHERVGPQIRADGLKFVVEAGNKNDADLARMFKALTQKYPEFGQYFVDLTFVPKVSCRAIQVADAIAFLFRKHANGFYADPSASYPPMLDRVIRRVEHYGVVSTGFHKEKPNDR